MIYDVTTNDFDEAVIKKSYEIPVLVDFWAEWCGPCQMLTPVLEKVVQSMNKRVALAKVNTESEALLAQRFGVRGIPNVKLFIDGHIVSEFQGAIAESQIRAFIETYCPSAATKLIQQGYAKLQEDLPKEALTYFQQALDEEPANEEAQFGLSRTLLRLGELEKARFWLEQLNPQIVRVQEMKELIQLMEQGGSAENQSLLSSDEEAARNYALGLQALNKAQFEAALKAFLESIRSDRNYSDGAARKSMLQIFSELGTKHPLTLNYQKKLASSLY